MKIRTWLSLLALLSAVAAARADDAAEKPPPAAAEYKPPAPSPMFNALWVRRPIFQHARYRLFVVQLLSPKSTKGLRGSKTLTLRAVADLSRGGKDFKPMNISVQVSLHTSRPLTGSRSRISRICPSGVNITARTACRWIGSAINISMLSKRPTQVSRLVGHFSVLTARSRVVGCGETALSVEP